MNKFEGVPFHGTPPSSKHVGNTVSSSTFSAKAVLGHAAYYGSMAALGIAGRGFMRGAVHAGRAAVYGNAALAARALGA